MAFKGLTITNDGLAVLAQSHLGSEMIISSIKIGDGSTNKDYDDMHDMSHTLYAKNPALHRNDNQVFLDVDITSNDGTGYYFREIGIFVHDKNGNDVLYAYDNAGDDAEYINPVDSGIAYEKRLRFCLIIDNKINVVVSTEGIIYALQSDFESHLHDVENPHAVTKKQVGLSNVSNDLQVKVDDIGKPNGVPALDENAIVLAEQLPFSKEEIMSNFDNYYNYNLLINGGFDIWQRGTTFTYDANKVTRYTADRWLCILPSNCNIKQSDNGLTIVKNIANQVALRQFVEISNSLMSSLTGAQVTLSMRFEVSLPIAFNYRVGNTDTRNFVCDKPGSYELDATFTLNDNDLSGGKLDVLLFSNVDALCTIAFNFAKLEYGKVATPPVSRPYGVELGLCQRYYCSDIVAQGLPYSYHGNNQYYCHLYGKFPESMRIVPTIRVLSCHVSTIGDVTDNMVRGGCNIYGIAGTWTIDFGKVIATNAYFNYLTLITAELDAEIY